MLLLRSAHWLPWGTGALTGGHQDAREQERRAGNLHGGACIYLHGAGYGAAVGSHKVTGILPEEL